MEIVNKNVTFLSNCEVFHLLQQTKDDLAQKVLTKKSNRHNTNPLANTTALTEQQSASIDKHLPTVIYESLRFLETTACVHQTPDIVEAFLAKLEAQKSEFKLTRAEKLQLINQRPGSAVELQVLIEDNEERFTLEQMDDLLDFVLENLPEINSESTENQIELDQA